MIPTKRSSPFVRARSFQNTQGRKGQAGDGNDGPSPSKRPSFATAKSSPFQVLSPSLINTKNPFEKLSQSSVKRLSNYDSSANNDSQGNPEDEDLDPNQTLKIFSLSQLAKEIPSNELDILEESAEDEVYEELDQESAPLNHSITIDKSDPSQYSGKPNLRDALAKSAVRIEILKTLRASEAKELI
ncbi:hypothetical protein BGZ49_008508 [Haplosporangium sp. Z 27]|nr:hypothetical protein BGZ49_008508 [Haplosporangium sp. Z 27]